MSLLLHSISFLSLCFILYWYVLPTRWRSIFLSLASMYFMSLFSIKFAAYFVFNALLVYFAGICMRRSEKNAKRYLVLTLVWLIGSLSVFKYTHLVLNSIFTLGAQFADVPEMTFTKIALPLGISFVVFRLIHYIVEIYRKSLPEHNFWELALFVFFFPTFIAGPVDRFQKFQPQTAANKPLDVSDINDGLLRIISGLVKKFVVADALLPVIMPILASPQDSSRILIILALYGFAIQVYMDFSGYTDMAIGVARLFGYKIMENFNYPYFKKNIALFWRNWHMSVYSFIRDYFFFPFFGYKASTIKIYIGMFLTMVVFCLWHDGNIPFLLLGIYHGSGLVIWQLFQEVKRKTPWLRKLVDNKYADPFSIFITFSFVSFSFIFFGFDAGSIGGILQKIF